VIVVIAFRTPLLIRHQQRISDQHIALGVGWHGLIDGHVWMNLPGHEIRLPAAGVRIAKGQQTVKTPLGTQVIPAHQGADEHGVALSNRGGFYCVSEKTSVHAHAQECSAGRVVRQHEHWQPLAVGSAHSSIQFFLANMIGLKDMLRIADMAWKRQLAGVILGFQLADALLIDATDQPAYNDH